MHRELNGRQRLELALYEEDLDAAAANPDRRAYVAALALVAKYARTEGLTREHFDRRDAGTFPRCQLAVGLQQYPDDFEPGCMGHDVLTAAGFFPPAGAAAPAQDTQ